MTLEALCLKRATLLIHVIHTIHMTHVHSGRVPILPASMEKQSVHPTRGSCRKCCTRCAHTHSLSPTAMYRMGIPSSQRMFYTCSEILLLPQISRGDLYLVAEILRAPNVAAREHQVLRLLTTLRTF